MNASSGGSGWSGRDSHPLSVQFIKFPCSFREKLWQIIGWHPLLEVFVRSGKFWIPHWKQNKLRTLKLRSSRSNSLCIMALSDTSTGEDEDQEIKNQPNTALLSLILTFGTFLLAYALKGFRNSQFLGRSVSLSIKFSGLVWGSFTLIEADTKNYAEKIEKMFHANPRKLIP